MAHQQFSISQVNPNASYGGLGCACDPNHQIDCKPPYVVFHGTLMADPMSPHVVLCESCLRKALERMENEEGLIVGEQVDHDLAMIRAEREHELVNRRHEMESVDHPLVGPRPDDPAPSDEDEPII